MKNRRELGIIIALSIIALLILSACSNNSGTKIKLKNYVLGSKYVNVLKQVEKELNAENYLGEIEEFTTAGEHNIGFNACEVDFDSYKADLYLNFYNQEGKEENRNNSVLARVRYMIDADTNCEDMTIDDIYKFYLEKYTEQFGQYTEEIDGTCKWIDGDVMLRINKSPGGITIDYFSQELVDKTFDY